MAKINFEQVHTEGIASSGFIWRGKVIGGWIVTIESASSQSLTFVPDPKHQWR